MNNQNNNQHYSRSDDYYGRRARGDGYHGGNYDVGGNQQYQRPRQGQQGYDNRRRQQYPQRQGYDNRGRQQYPQRQGYDSRGRQQSPQRQGYDNRGRQGYNDYYDGRRRQQRPQNGGYNDGYNGGRRPRSSYDNRNSSRGRMPRKRTSPAIIVVRVIAIIMLLVGAVIIGIKLFHSYSDKKGHSELQQLSSNLNGLYEKNHDFFGWIKIEDTVIDYPVMYTPDEPEKYLHTDFDGDYSESGELFMDADCDPNGYHYLIYGHHMFNGSMFGSLPKYDDQEYYENHKTIRFDTLSEQGEYEIFAVFYSQIFDANDNTDFQYYECENLNDESDYNYYVENVMSRSVINSGITPQYGQKIITLSTCNYHTEDGRFVVCAVKK